MISVMLPAAKYVKANRFPGHMAGLLDAAGSGPYRKEGAIGSVPALPFQQESTHGADRPENPLPQGPKYTAKVWLQDYKDGMNGHARRLIVTRLQELPKPQPGTAELETC
jgi:hypothetical protein